MLFDYCSILYSRLRYIGSTLLLLLISFRTMKAQYLADGYPTLPPMRLFFRDQESVKKLLFGPSFMSGFTVQCTCCAYTKPQDFEAGGGQKRASIAQWLEHWSCKPGVESSILSGGSGTKKNVLFFLFRNRSVCQYKLTTCTKFVTLQYPCDHLGKLKKRGRTALSVFLFSIFLFLSGRFAFRFHQGAL